MNEKYITKNIGSNFRNVLGIGTFFQILKIVAKT